MIDTNWCHVHYGQLTPIGVKAASSLFSLFTLGLGILRSTSGLWLATNRRYLVMASGHTISNLVDVTDTVKQAARLPLRSTWEKVPGCYR